VKGICARRLWACAHKGKNKARCARTPRHSGGRSTSLHQQSARVRPEMHRLCTPSCGRMTRSRCKCEARTYLPSRWLSRVSAFSPRLKLWTKSAVIVCAVPVGQAEISTAFFGQYIRVSRFQCFTPLIARFCSGNGDSCQPAPRPGSSNYAASSLSAGAIEHHFSLQRILVVREQNRCLS